MLTVSPSDFRDALKTSKQTRGAKGCLTKERGSAAD